MIMATKKKSTARASKRSGTNVRRSVVAASEDRIFNLVPSTGTESDWTMTDLVEAGVFTAAPLPASVDLRATWWKVGDQGRTGSCVGWATADGVGRYLMAAAGRIAKKDRLSPRFVWMGSKETDEFTSRPSSFIEGDGTSLKAAMDIARKYGFAMEDQVPFEIATLMYTGDENALYASCAQRRVSYVNLGLDLSEWKQMLAAGRPILAGLRVDHNWMSVGSDGLLNTFAANTVRGGHAAEGLTAGF